MTTGDPAGAGDLRAVGPGHPDVAAAEHWIGSLDPAPPLACTHLVRTPYPHVVVTLDATPGGRAVLFPGVPRLVGTMRVADVTELSRIDRVEALGGAPVDPGTLLDTRGFVRPVWRGDELVLITMPAAGGCLVPFETPDPTPCCVTH